MSKTPQTVEEILDSIPIKGAMTEPGYRKAVEAINALIEQERTQARIAEDKFWKKEIESRLPYGKPYNVTRNALNYRIMALSTGKAGDERTP